MKRFKIFIIILFISNAYFAQDRAMKKMALYYNQGNYRLAFWKADELLNNPDYDTSMLPIFYKSISLYHLQDKFLFRKRELMPWLEATNLFKSIKSNPLSKKIFLEHKDEISNLRDYLYNELEWLKIKNDIKKSDLLAKSIKGLFDGIKLNPQKSKWLEEKTKKDIKLEKPLSEIAENRMEIIDLATKCIGIPYVFGGDSLDGFDCSGFTGYVYQKFDLKTGRSSRDQYQSCKKINKEDVLPGDLIFFNSGKEEVTHVGMIVSKPGEPLKMIHSSSSKGVIITEIESSEYWMKKLTGFGTFFD